MSCRDLENMLILPADTNTLLYNYLPLVRRAVCRTSVAASGEVVALVTHGVSSYRHNLFVAVICA